MNGLFDSDIVPSIITLTSIYIVELVSVELQSSIYLANILHLFLCFHVLALFAVIAWKIEVHAAGHKSSTTRYAHFVQPFALMAVMFSVFKLSDLQAHCGSPIVLDILLHHIPANTASVTLVFVIPYLLSLCAVVITRRFCGVAPAASVLLGFLWLAILSVIIAIVEGTISSNRAIVAGDVHTRWTFDQVSCTCVCIVVFSDSNVVRSYPSL